MLLQHLPNQRLAKSHYFGEKRPVHLLGIGALANVIGGAVSKMKGGGKAMADGANKMGEASVATEKTGLFRAKSATGYILKSPFILTRKSYELVMSGMQKGADIAKGAGAKVGEVLRTPVMGTIQNTRELISHTLEAGYNCTAGAGLAIAKSNFYDFPHRALVKQFGTGISMMVGTTGAFFGNSINAVKKTLLSPFTLIGSCRDAIKNVLIDTPKDLWKQDYSGALKNIGQAPLNILEGITSAPIAWAGIPYHTGMEIVVGGIGIAANAGSALMTPKEGAVNAIRSVGKSKKLVDYIKNKCGIVSNYRDRIMNTVTNAMPFRTANAAA